MQIVKECSTINGTANRVMVLPLDTKFAVDLKGFYGNMYLSQTLSEAVTISFLVEHLENGMVFIDIGSNLGYMTVLGAKAVGDGHVYAFEPNSNLFDTFWESVNLNHLTNVTLSDEALSDRESQSADLYVSLCADNTGLSSLMPVSRCLEAGFLSESNVMKVKTTTFDAWASAHSELKRIDMIKIDVEGAELLVLKGMTQTLSQFKPKYIICETIGGSDVGAVLQELNYRESPLEVFWPEKNWGNFLYSRM